MSIYYMSIRVKQKQAINKNPDLDNDPIINRGILVMQLIMNFIGT